MHEQTVLAARIVGFDGIHDISINVDGNVLLSWFNRATKEGNIDDEDIPIHIRGVACN